MMHKNFALRLSQQILPIKNLTYCGRPYTRALEFSRWFKPFLAYRSLTQWVVLPSRALGSACRNQWQTGAPLGIDECCGTLKWKKKVFFGVGLIRPQFSACDPYHHNIRGPLLKQEGTFRQLERRQQLGAKNTGQKSPNKPKQQNRICKNLDVVRLWKGEKKFFYVGLILS